MAQLKDTTVTGDLSVSGNQTVKGTVTTGSQTVTGNIAVSGTVDGRDVSVDGAKLDTTVVGPASSVDNSIPVFDGITGKLLKDKQVAFIDILNNLGVGTQYPTQKLDIVGNMNLGYNVTDETTRSHAVVKSGALSLIHYLLSEENVSVFYSNSGSTTNSIGIGGGVSSQNAATLLQFYTAANTTTLTGTERMRITKEGNVGIANNNPTEKLHVTGNIAVSGTVDGRDVSVDGAKLDDSVDVSSGVVYKKFAKTLNITSTSNTVTLFTIPSSKIAFMGFNEPKIVIHSYGSLATNDAVVRLTYQSHSGDGEITQDISLDKMSAAPYYNVLEISATPKIMGPGAVTMSVITAGTSGTVLIKGEVTW